MTHKLDHFEKAVKINKMALAIKKYNGLSRFKPAYKLVIAYV